MAFLLAGERPIAAAAPFNLFRTFACWIAKARRAREQRLALDTLLELDTARLDDLGINRGDLFDALDAQRPTRMLDSRRSRRASDWLNP